MSVKSMMLDALVSIQDTPVEDRRNTGICEIVEDYIHCKYDCDGDVFDFVDVVHDELSALFKEWPEFSGEQHFPVPGGHADYFGSHKWGGSYGAARVRLLEWLIERLEHDKKNEKA